MRIAFLGSPNSWYLSDLRRVASGSDTITPFAFDSLAGYLPQELAAGGELVTARVFEDRDQPEPACLPLSDYDLILVRTMPLGSLEQVIFRMDCLARLQAMGIPVINSPRALEVAIDKYMALVKLRELGYRVPETVSCQRVEDAMEAYERFDGDVVVKPIFGGEGRGIMRLSDSVLAERAFRALVRLSSVLYVQRFVDHNGCDIRLLVIGEEVFGMRRVAVGDWRTNISQGGRGEPYTISTAERQMAREISAALGAPILGLDLLQGTDGNTYLPEVNAVPGWRALCGVTKVDIASKLLEFLRVVVSRREPR